MKTKSSFLLLSTLLGGILFSLMFWQERLALNLFMYSVFLLAIALMNTEIPKTRKFFIYGSAQLMAAVLVVLNNSDLSIATYYFSMLVFVGYAHYQSIRSIYIALIAGILQIIAIPASLVRKLSDIQIGRFNLKPVFRLIKYMIFPIIIVIIFTVIYSSANEVFDHYLNATLDSFAAAFDRLFGFLFKDLSLPRFLHLCFGLLLTGGLIITFYDKGLEKAEMGCKEQLLRLTRKDRTKSIWYEVIRTFSGQMTKKKLALKTEYIIGVISFLALNLLLLSVNAIDVSTLWFGHKPSGNFSADLHEGTNALIVSIVMAMIVIVYFFRGNLNFYSKSKFLRLLAYTWMVQNFVLIISVLIRDGYYIEFHGLTHKRIGVMVFSLLCMVGLSTVYLKVAKQKTLFYLFKANGHIWFALLLAFSTMNWDLLIVKYNLNNRNHIAFDPDYLLSLSDKTLAILDQNRNALQGADLVKEVPKRSDTYHLQQLDQRIGYFTQRYIKERWLSWNLPDWRVAEHFQLNSQRK